jgi:rRNA-processing protein FCF1
VPLAAATVLTAVTLVVIAQAVAEDRAVVAVDHAVAAEAIPAVAAKPDCFAFLSNGPEFRGRFLLAGVPFFHYETLVELLRKRLKQLRPKFLK